MTNIHITTAHLSFIEALRVLLFKANADTAFEAATFATITTSIRCALADALFTDTDLDFGECTLISHALYSGMIDNGEDTAYQVHLFNTGVIDSSFRI